MEQTINPEPLWLARRRQGLTQKQVAAKLGKHRFTIIRIETGNLKGVVSNAVVREYAELLGVDPAEVLTQEECAAG